MATDGIWPWNKFDKLSSTVQRKVLPVASSTGFRIGSNSGITPTAAVFYWRRVLASNETDPRNRSGQLSSHCVGGRG